MASKYERIILVIILSIFIILLSVICLLGILINKKSDLTLEFFKISQYPTGDICIGALGKPLHKLDGEKDFDWYKNFTNLRDQKSFIGKKIYLWQAPRFHYIIVVIDKNTDQVNFVTYHPM